MRNPQSSPHDNLLFLEFFHQPLLPAAYHFLESDLPETLPIFHQKYRLFLHLLPAEIVAQYLFQTGFCLHPHRTHCDTIHLQEPPGLRFLLRIAALSHHKSGIQVSYHNCSFLELIQNRLLFFHLSMLHTNHVQ